MEKLTQFTHKKNFGQKESKRNVYQSTQFPLVSGRKFFLALNRLRVSETLLNKNPTDVCSSSSVASTPSIHNAILWGWGYPLYKIVIFKTMRNNIVLFVYSCFPMSCQFLLYNEMNQLYNMYTYIPSLLDLPPIPPQSHPSRSSQRTELNFLRFTAGSHCLSVLYMVVYICQS